MSWLKNLLPSRIRTDVGTKKGVPEGLWTKCPECQGVLYRNELRRNRDVCPKCSHHLRVSARQRLQDFLDADDLLELATDVEATDHLKFRDSKKYKDRIVAAQKKTGEKEALIAYRGKLHGMPVAACAFEFGFIGGSMSSGVGERFVRAANVALEFKIPFICFAASGGARMQEGLISLMQMTKTSAILRRLSENGIPYICVLTDPTMAGVSASLATLGDVIIAEPKALIGFTGPRVIEQTVREKLPEGFQRSEFLLEHGHIDMIVDRRKMRDTVASILSKLMHLEEPFSKESDDMDDSEDLPDAS